MSKKEVNKQKTLELYNLGLKGKEIAERLNLSAPTISIYIKELREEGKIRERRESPIKKKNKQKTLELYNLGLKGKEIAKRLNLSSVTISRYIKELEEEGKIQRTNINKVSSDIQKILNRENFTKNEYEKFSKYILKCQEELSNNDLKEEELAVIKQIADLTYKYDYILFYIKACIHLGKMQEAKKAVNSARISGEFSTMQKQNLDELAKKIIEIGKKKTAIIMLKQGKGVREIAEYSGLREAEVVQLNRMLIAKNRNRKPGDGVGEGR